MFKELTSLLNEVWKFIKSDFHLSSYLFTFFIVGVAVYFNYSGGFYSKVLLNSYFDGTSVWIFPVFYVIVYFSVAIPVVILRKDVAVLRTPGFYFKSLFIIVIYGLSIGYYGYHQWQFPSLFDDESKFVLRLVSQLKSLVFYFVPLVLLKLIVDRKTKGLYGLSLNTSYLKGYFSFFLLLLPFLILASYSADFQTAYPQFKPWFYEGVLGLETWESTALFEISYVIDFVMTELLFRGALVIGMVGLMGRGAVLPMVALYVVIHFGKPPVEAMSSLFGGYILGALAYQTRHIWGGVIVHVFIALTMEIMGLFQYYVPDK